MRVKDLIHLLETRVEDQDAEIEIQTYVVFGKNETDIGKRGVTAYRSDINDSFSSSLEVYENEEGIVFLNIENQMVSELSLDIFKGKIKKEDVLCEHQLAELELEESK